MAVSHADWTGDKETGAEAVASILRRAVKRPEHLVVNCWRSVREVALLLGGRLTQDALLPPSLQPQLNLAQVNSLKIMRDFQVGFYR